MANDEQPLIEEDHSQNNNNAEPAKVTSKLAPEGYANAVIKHLSELVNNSAEKRVINEFLKQHKYILPQAFKQLNLRESAVVEALIGHDGHVRIGNFFDVLDNSDMSIAVPAYMEKIKAIANSSEKHFSLNIDKSIDLSKQVIDFFSKEYKNQVLALANKSLQSPDTIKDCVNYIEMQDNTFQPLWLEKFITRSANAVVKHAKNLLKKQADAKQIKDFLSQQDPRVLEKAFEQLELRHDALAIFFLSEKETNALETLNGLLSEPTALTKCDSVLNGLDQLDFNLKPIFINYYQQKVVEEVIKEARFLLALGEEKQCDDFLRQQSDRVIKQMVSQLDIKTDPLCHRLLQHSIIDIFAPEKSDKQLNEFKKLVEDDFACTLKQDLLLKQEIAKQVKQSIVNHVNATLQYYLSKYPHVMKSYDYIDDLDDDVLTMLGEQHALSNIADIKQYYANVIAECVIRIASSRLFDKNNMESTVLVNDIVSSHDETVLSNIKERLIKRGVIDEETSVIDYYQQQVTHVCMDNVVSMLLQGKSYEECLRYTFDHGKNDKKAFLENYPDWFGTAAQRITEKLDTEITSSHTLSLLKKLDKKLIKKIEQDKNTKDIFEFYTKKVATSVQEKIKHALSNPLTMSDCLPLLQQQEMEVLLMVQKEMNLKVDVTEHFVNHISDQVIKQVNQLLKNPETVKEVLPLLIAQSQSVLGLIRIKLKLTVDTLKHFTELSADVISNYLDKLDSHDETRPFSLPLIHQQDNEIVLALGRRYLPAIDVVKHYIDTTSRFIRAKLTENNGAVNISKLLKAADPSVIKHVFKNIDLLDNAKAFLFMSDSLSELVKKVSASLKSPDLNQQCLLEIDAADKSVFDCRFNPAVNFKADVINYFTQVYVNRFIEEVSKLCKSGDSFKLIECLNAQSSRVLAAAKNKLPNLDVDYKQFIISTAADVLLRKLTSLNNKDERFSLLKQTHEVVLTQVFKELLNGMRVDKFELFFDEKTMKQGFVLSDQALNMQADFPSREDIEMFFIGEGHVNQIFTEQFTQHLWQKRADKLTDLINVLSKHNQLHLHISQIQKQPAEVLQLTQQKLKLKKSVIEHVSVQGLREVKSRIVDLILKQEDDKAEKSIRQLLDSLDQSLKAHAFQSLQLLSALCSFKISDDKIKHKLGLQLKAGKMPDLHAVLTNIVKSNLQTGKYFTEQQAQCLGIKSHVKEAFSSMITIREMKGLLSDQETIKLQQSLSKFVLDCVAEAVLKQAEEFVYEGIFIDACTDFFKQQDPYILRYAQSSKLLNFNHQWRDRLSDTLYLKFQSILQQYRQGNTNIVTFFEQFSAIVLLDRCDKRLLPDISKGNLAVENPEQLSYAFTLLNHFEGTVSKIESLLNIDNLQQHYNEKIANAAIKQINVWRMKEDFSACYDLIKTLDKSITELLKPKLKLAVDSVTGYYNVTRDHLSQYNESIKNPNQVAETFKKICQLEPVQQSRLAKDLALADDVTLIDHYGDKAAECLMATFKHYKKDNQKLTVYENLILQQDSRVLDSCLLKMQELNMDFKIGIGMHQHRLSTIMQKHAKSCLSNIEEDDELKTMLDSPVSGSPHNSNN